MENPNRKTVTAEVLLYVLVYNVTGDHTHFFFHVHNAQTPNVYFSYCTATSPYLARIYAKKFKDNQNLVLVTLHIVCTSHSTPVIINFY
jgi:hypothetical protein